MEVDHPKMVNATKLVIIIDIHCYSFKQTFGADIFSKTLAK